MKNSDFVLWLLMLVLMVSSASAQGEWRPIVQLDSTIWMDVSFADPENGWISYVSYKSRRMDAGLMRTDDAGLTWDTIALKTSVGYSHLLMANRDVGWAWTGNGDPSLLLTTDRGKNWIKRGESFASVPVPGRFTPDGMNLFPDGRLVAVGYYQAILISSDSGKSWQMGHLIEHAPGWQRFFAVDVIDEKNAVAVGGVNGRLIAWTRDGGRSWQVDSSELRTTFSNYRAVAFYDTLHGVILDERYKSSVITHDGGETWSLLNIPEELCPNATFRDVAYPASNEIWIVARCGLEQTDSRVLHSVDGGLSWEAQLFPNARLERILFSDSATGYAVGTGGAYRWSPVSGVEERSSPSWPAWMMLR